MEEIERLEVFAGFGSNDDGARRQRVAVCYTAEDAHHIVACVNYCAGLEDNDMISATESGNGAADTIKALSGKCDELLAALNLFALDIGDDLDAARAEFGQDAVDRELKRRAAIALCGVQS